MAKRKVRHATVQYYLKDSSGNVLSYETAFRGMIVDIPEDQVERLDSLYATVPEDADLERPGRMLTLPDTAGDAEILSWVMGASNAEVEALVVERPAMAARITAAKESVTSRFEEQNLHLGGLQKIAEESVEKQAEADKVAAEAAALAAGQSATDQEAAAEAARVAADAAAAEAQAEAARVAAEADLIGTGTLSPEQADEVVKGNAKSVTDYISENPNFAAAVLEAEGRRATATKEPVRVSVARSAEAAAGFTAQ